MTFSDETDGKVHFYQKYTYFLIHVSLSSESWVHYSKTEPAIIRFMVRQPPQQTSRCLLCNCNSKFCNQNVLLQKVPNK